jgi:NAD(P)H dehydrogenase (quinone)
MILVTGAAGKTGKAAVKALAARGAAVRARVRNPEHAATLTVLGAAEVSVGGFEDPRALADAAAGARAIYHICPNVSPQEVVYAQAVAAAAQARGIKRFVYHSVLHPQIEAMPHHWQKMRVEEMLFAAGFDLTVLQPTTYMQNILGARRGIVAEGVFRVPYPVETRLSLVDLDDLAEVAALVLTQDGHSGASYEPVMNLSARHPLARRKSLPQSVRRWGGAYAPKQKPSRLGKRTHARTAWASMNAARSRPCSAITPIMA